MNNATSIVYTSSSSWTLVTSHFLQTTSENSSYFQFTSSMLPGSRSYVGTAIGLITGTFGTTANMIVFTVLMLARRQYVGKVNSIIANQSAIDLFGCFFILITAILALAEAYQYTPGRGDVANTLLCALFQAGGLTVLGMNAGKIGLVVITLERYFMIVHAVAHRKYFRSWMTLVAVAVPWIDGFAAYLLPSLFTSRVIRGRCAATSVWPNSSMRKMYAVFQFVWHYILPMTIFAYCYGRIFLVIRRQSKVVAGHAGRAQNAGGTSSSSDANTGESAATGGKLNRMEMNVLQTMVAVILCFVICWTPIATINVLLTLQWITIDRSYYYLLSAFGYINLCINPVIYAGRYEVFKNYVKDKIKKSNTVNSMNSQNHTVMSSVAASKYK